MGRKTKYGKEMTDLLCSYIREGDSQRLACKKAGITESTFFDWASKKPEFSSAIKKAKDEFQATIVGKLEASLWKRAMGYEVTETDTEYVSDSEGNPRIKSQKTKVKHVQPDTGALIFALTNVAPDKWVNKQKMEMQETKAKDSQPPSFEDLPEDVLFDIADKIQDAEKRKLSGEKEGENA